MSDDENNLSKEEFQRKIEEFMENNKDLAADLEVTPQQELFIQLHDYYGWLKSGGFTTSESLEFLVIYLIRMLERFGGM